MYVGSLALREGSGGVLPIMTDRPKRNVVVIIGMERHHPGTRLMYIDPLGRRYLPGTAKEAFRASLGNLESEKQLNILLG